MNLTDYVQINLPKKYQKSGCGLFFMNFQLEKEFYCIDLLSRLKCNDCRFVNNGPYYYWYQPPLLFWEKWVDENVFSDTNLCDINIKTNMVLIRIATGMLNKLTCITEDEKRLLHSLLIEFYTERKRVYMDFYYKEIIGLPF